MKTVKNYRWALTFLLLQLGIFLINNSTGENAFYITTSNFKEMLLLIPPIFIIIGLMDVWVPRETLIKYMGKGSGAIGLLIVFILGTAAAGPLYVAFPMGLLLLQKGARLSNVIFFLGVWSSTKLPIVLFEAASLGVKFTFIHIAISLPLYFFTAYYIEKTTSEEAVALITAPAD